MYTPPLSLLLNRQCLCGYDVYEMRGSRVIAGDERSELVREGRERAGRTPLRNKSRFAQAEHVAAEIPWFGAHDRRRARYLPTARNYKVATLAGPSGEAV